MVLAGIEARSGPLPRAKAELPEAELVIELGRYLVGEADNFGPVIRKNHPGAIGNRIDATEKGIASVVGPLCTPLDLLADRMELSRAEPGDLVVIFQSGAYGASASPQAFLGHPP